MKTLLIILGFMYLSGCAAAQVYDREKGITIKYYAIPLWMVDDLEGAHADAE